MGKLASSVALITGGASGLGLCIARRLAAEGARVMITDTQAVLGRETAARHSLMFAEQDVTREGQWNDVIKEIESGFGALHILVNNAGITGAMERFTREDTTADDWRRVQKVNVEGVFLGCRAAIPALRRAGGGVIVNMSSIVALIAMPEGVAYGASKAAVRHITKSVALPCARDGSKIRCNSVHPGNVITPMLEQAMAGIALSNGVPYEQVREQFKAENPQGEFVTPEDIASVVFFLVSDEARHINGAQLVVDGGASLMATA